MWKVNQDIVFEMELLQSDQHKEDKYKLLTYIHTHTHMQSQRLDLGSLF